jgi:glycosyltransferase involved in cell wall biosynthesis
MCEFSVIIPTYNRPRLLTACVESVLAQSFPAERYEVIVVDDGSRRQTARVLASYLNGGRVRYLRQRRRGWGAARLLGAQDSQGEILVFIDDDCTAPPGWLACYAQAYTAHPDAGGVGGGLRPGARMNVAGRKQYLGHLARFDRLNAPLGTRADQAGRAWFTFGGNRTFRREMWLAAQARAPASWYYDDYLIDLNLREMGVCVYYEPAAWVTHHYVLGVAQRVRAAYRYGRSEVQVGLPDDVADGAAVAPLGRWRRLKAEAPEASLLDRAWYAMTQPLVWFARRVGHFIGRGGA